MVGKRTFLLHISLLIQLKFVSLCRLRPARKFGTLSSILRIFIYSVPYPIIAQDKRITVVDALAHPYLDEGRLRYHSCMCTCCYTTSAGMRQYRVDFEPSAAHPFDDLWERKLTSVQQVKGEKIRGIKDST